MTITVTVVPPLQPSNNVRGVCPELAEDGHTVVRFLVPLLPRRDHHFLLTVLYDLLRFGVPWIVLQTRYTLPPRLTPQMVVDYVFAYGRKIYGDHARGQGFWGYVVVTEWGGMDMPIPGATVPWLPTATNSDLPATEATL